MLNKIVYVTDIGLRLQAAIGYINKNHHNMNDVVLIKTPL
jgi:hypothetical protein